MSRPTAASGFPWGIWALSALALYAGTIILKYKYLDLALGDTDDAMRLVQLRTFLQHGNWFDLHLSRVAPPEGYVSHWSRIPDALMAIIYWFTLPFSSMAVAEKAVRIVYPGLWMIPAFTAISYFAFRLTSNRLVVVVTLLMLVLNPATFTQFVAGRIDHHNAQIALALVTVIASALQRLDWRFAIISGLSGGLLLTIGLEAIPFVVIAAAACAVNYVINEDGEKPTQFFALSLAGATLIGHLLSYSPSNVLVTACDALAANMTLGVVTGCATLLIWTKLQRLNATLFQRIFGVACAGALAAVVYGFMDSACLKGPFGHINPAVKPIWLDRVIEMQPVLSWSDAAKNLKQLPFVYVLLPAILTLVLLLKDSANRKNFALLVLIGAFAISLPLGLLNLRMATYISWFATPLICVALFQIGRTQGTKTMATIVALSVLFSPLAMSLWVKKVAEPFVTANTQQQSKAGSCTQTADYSFLAQQPKGLILSEIDLGPFVLALTPHDIVVAPYHRMSDRIIEVMDFFERDDIEKAHQKALTMGAKYVVICDKQSTASKNEDADSLFAQIRSKQTPTWLSPLKSSGQGSLLIFTVLPE